MSEDPLVIQQEPRRPHILLGVTGSVATIKLPELAQRLLELGDVRVISTAAARHFIDEALVPEAAKPLLGDDEEWRSWHKVGDPVLHIELRRWADLLVIAPLSANTLAKVATGMSDNLLTCVVRAWDYRDPLLVAPAMNTLMWENPFTAQHLQVLQGLGVQVVPPVVKTLACGDTGVGALATPANIALAVAAALGQQRSAGLLQTTAAVDAALSHS